jgi:hypothetical protein
MQEPDVLGEPLVSKTADPGTSAGRWISVTQVAASAKAVR